MPQKCMECRGILLRRGLEFHVCTISKGAHTKSLETYIMILVYIYLYIYIYIYIHIYIYIYPRYWWHRRSHSILHSWEDIDSRMKDPKFKTLGVFFRRICEKWSSILLLSAYPKYVPGSALLTTNHRFASLEIYIVMNKAPIRQGWW